MGRAATGHTIATGLIQPQGEGRARGTWPFSVGPSRGLRPRADVGEAPGKLLGAPLRRKGSGDLRREKYQLQVTNLKPS